MRLALVALALTLPAASSAEAPVPPKAGRVAAPARLCSQDLKARDALSPRGVSLRRLGELPPGDLALTVVNRVGDCIEPVVVRQRYGAVDGGPGR
jgi:hypothetical protein